MRRQDDKEVRLQTDQHDIAHGDYIQANMNEEPGAENWTAQIDGSEK